MEGKKGALIPSEGPLREEFQLLFNPVIKEEIPFDSSSCLTDASAPQSQNVDETLTVVKHEEPPIILPKGSIIVEDSIDIEESFGEESHTSCSKKIKVEIKEKEAASHKPSVPVIKQEPLPIYDESVDDDDCIILDICQPSIKTELVDLDEDSTVPNSPEEPSSANSTEISAVLGLASEKLASIASSKQSHSPVSSPIKTTSIKSEISSPPSKKLKLNSHTSPGLVSNNEPVDPANPTEEPLNLPQDAGSSSVKNNCNLSRVKEEAEENPPEDESALSSSPIVKAPLSVPKDAIPPSVKDVTEKNPLEVNTVSSSTNVFSESLHSDSPTDLCTPTLLPFLHLNYKLDKEELNDVIISLNWLNVESIKKLDEVQKSEKYFESRGTANPSMVDSKKIKLRILTDEDDLPSEVFNAAHPHISGDLVKQYFSSNGSQASFSKPPNYETNPLNNTGGLSCHTERQEVAMDISPIKLTLNEAPESNCTVLEMPSAVSSQDTMLSEFSLSEVLNKASSSEHCSLVPSVVATSPQLLSRASNRSISSFSEVCKTSAVPKEAIPEKNRSVTDISGISNEDLRKVLQKAKTLTASSKRTNTDAGLDLPDPKKGPRKININEYREKKFHSNKEPTQGSSDNIRLTPQISSQTAGSYMNLPIVKPSSIPSQNWTEGIHPSINNEMSPPPNLQLGNPVIPVQNAPGSEPMYLYPDFGTPVSYTVPYYLQNTNLYTSTVSTYPIVSQSINPLVLPVQNVSYHFPYMTQTPAFIQSASQTAQPTGLGLSSNYPTHDLEKNHSSHITLPERRFLKLLTETVTAKLGSDYLNPQEFPLIFLVWSVRQMTTYYERGEIPNFGMKFLKVRSIYQKAEDHYHTYLPLLMLEFFHRTFHHIKPGRLFSTCKSYSWKKGLVSCTISDRENGGHVEKNGMVMLRICEPDITTKILGYVSNFRRGHGKCKVYVETGFERCFSGEVKRVEALGLGPGKWLLDQHLAIANLRYSPLAKCILNPRMHPVTMVITLSSSDSRLLDISVDVKTKFEEPSIYLLRTASSVSTVERVVKLVTLITKKPGDRVLILVKTNQMFDAVGLALLKHCSASFDLVTFATRASRTAEDISVCLMDKDLDRDGGITPFTSGILEDASCILAFASYCFFEELKPNLKKCTCILLEAHLVSEPESLVVPILYGATKFILVGDSTIQCRTISPHLTEFGYGSSLFHRLCKGSVK